MCCARTWSVSGGGDQDAWQGAGGDASVGQRAVDGDDVGGIAALLEGLPLVL